MATEPTGVPYPRGQVQQRFQGVWNRSRCVRRAYLCGQDPLTGQDYSYRRVWILLREEQLAGLFTIDIEFHSEMSNHLHMVLRPCPRAAKGLGAEEVARRWLTITKLAKCMSDELPVPDEKRSRSWPRTRSGSKSCENS